MALSGFEGGYWRAVEDQYAVATMKLVDSLDEHAVLEGVLDATKPPLPASARHLHCLYATPFRYISNARATHFRGPVEAGVLYAAQTQVTAMHEVLWHSGQFYANAPDMMLPANAISFSVFDVPLYSDACLDISTDPLAQNTGELYHSSNYTASQDFAATARAVGADLIVYGSLRDPDGGKNAAVLEPTVLARQGPKAQEPWHLYLGKSEAKIYRLVQGVEIVVRF